jgi:spermidine/putrescine transport system substrate-binding protein
MNRRTFFLGLSGLAGCTSSRKPRLNVFNWSDYLGKDTVSGFERESGAEVRYAVYESNEEMLAKVFGGNSGWDVVFPSNYFIQPMRESRLLAPVRHQLLSNIGNLDTMLSSPVWDPGLEWSVPYMWGATGIIYNKQLSPAPSGWADLWNHRLKGRMTMLDDPADAMGAALKKLGLSINTPAAGDMKRAQRELLSQKPLVRAYLNAEARDQLVAGDLLAAQLWATTSAQAMEAAPHLDFVYPREGFALYADNAVILRESRKQELAHEFINFLLRPEVASEIVRVSKTATANAAARALLPEPLRNSPVLYPDSRTLARGEWFAPLPSQAQRMRDRMWTEIKSA